ncbi:hypothetical protein ACH5RR_009933 [Cinchona calisaya]|uniref:RBR-type E3 ubiquitin transferase n=1 Tax=Cinchona calisaya TaxID=153742 RepID=A0ABD3AFK6_9GENT
MANIEELNDIVAYGEGGSSSSSSYSVYFQGSLPKEAVNIEEEDEIVVGVGVVICDPMKIVISELSKPIKTGRDTGRLEAKLDALIQALNAAKQLRIAKLRFFSNDAKLYNYLTRDENSKEGLNIETEIELKLRPKLEMVNHLRTQFDRCRPSFALLNDGKHCRRAWKLAREATLSHTTKETCRICLEDVDVLKMLSVHDCLHRCCPSCVKKHVEVSLRQGALPKCPHEGCDLEIIIDRCTKVLNSELIEIMNQRVKEAQIPVAKRIYCPYPRCSNLMSKREVLNHSKSKSMNVEQSGYRMCLKCQGCFCVNCKVPWHSQMTCSDYKMLHPYSSTEDEMLNSLAKRNSWRQCAKCSHMIELDVGCYHIICRCGHQFCYTCGSEWKKNKASCTCPLWDDHRIIY